MATNVPIDPDLLDPALELSGERTKQEAEERELEINHRFDRVV